MINKIKYLKEYKLSIIKQLNSIKNNMNFYNIITMSFLRVID